MVLQQATFVLMWKKDLTKSSKLLCCPIVAESTILINKPLVEAIFEFRWKIPEVDGHKIDPDYSFLIGQLYNKCKKKYPERETLPAAQVPIEMLPYAPQYRFRTGKNQWPLIQLGHGILTYNSTSEYSWEQNFKPNSIEAFQNFIEDHPQENSLKLDELKLKYINAIPISPKDNVMSFLKEKLNTQIILPKDISESSDLEINNNAIDLTITVPVKNDFGQIQQRLATGMKINSKVLIIELTLVSKAVSNLFTNKSAFEEWLVKAHSIIEHHFFSLLSDDLLKEFKDE